MSLDPIHYIWNSPAVVDQFAAAVSLHSHTQYSKESLEFVPRYARRVPVLSQLVRQQEKRYQKLHGGRELDFDCAWWTPPLSAREAYELERNQIEKQLGLRGMVSLSDHDDIEAPMTLQILPEMSDIPISVEWTVPYGPSYFHIGVHNLPVRWAHDVLDRLSAYTEKPQEHKLKELFSILHGLPSVLTVLNHPLWDEPALGAQHHRNLLIRFLARHKEWIHALELNGLRPWHENFGVARIADDWNMPLISGGDRHGREPNAIVNLTNAATFAEFVAEVRCDQQSQVLFLQQCREPLRLRLMQSVLDVVRDYNDLPEGRRRWTDRVFFRNEANIVKPLSALWEGDGPQIVKLFMFGVRLLQSNRVKNALRLALSEKQEVSV